MVHVDDLQVLSQQSVAVRAGQGVISESVSYSLLTRAFFNALVGLAVDVGALSSFFFNFVNLIEVLLNLGSNQRHTSNVLGSESCCHEVFSAVVCIVFRFRFFLVVGFENGSLSFANYSRSRFVLVFRGSFSFFIFFR
jgi:hypothetical protein